MESEGFIEATLVRPKKVDCSVSIIPNELGTGDGMMSLTGMGRLSRPAMKSVYLAAAEPPDRGLLASSVTRI